MNTGMVIRTVIITGLGANPARQCHSAVQEYLRLFIKGEETVKHKIRRRNQRWLSEQYRYAMLNDLPMSFFTHISTQRAEMDNAIRLKRRGKLLPCWERATFFPGSVSLPFISSRDKTYYHQMFFEKAGIPGNYQAHWLEPVDDEDD